MPIIKSAIKRAKQSQVRRSRNLKVLAAVKTDVKATLAAAVSGDAKGTELALSAAFSEIDRAVKKGTLHKNTAARKKSRLTKSVAKTIAAVPTAAKKAAAKTEAKATAKKPATKKAAPKKKAK